MANARYNDPVIKKYIELIKANNGDIKTFFQGEPTRLGVSQLPCCIISKNETRAGNLTNAEDEHEMVLNLTIVTDIRQDLSTEDNDSRVVEGIAKLYDFVEGREEGTYKLKSTSILGILRGNISLDTANNLRTDLGSVTRINYGETLRSRAPEQWTIEARVEFVAHFSQVR